jgi:hypothetical protein
MDTYPNVNDPPPSMEASEAEIYAWIKRNHTEADWIKMLEDEDEPTVPAEVVMAMLEEDQRRYDQSKAASR